MSIKLLNYTKDYKDTLRKIIAVCHNKEMVGEKAIEHILESGHWSVLEHCSASFEVVMSRKVLAQLTRHRHFSFTVQSSRACKLTDYYRTGNKQIDYISDTAMRLYEQAVDRGVPYDEASYLLPESALCRVIITGSFRSYLEMIPKRTCKRALSEFQTIATEMYQKLQEVAPLIFKEDLMRNCSKCTEKSCSF